MDENPTEGTDQNCPKKSPPNQLKPVGWTEGAGFAYSRSAVKLLTDLSWERLTGANLLRAASRRFLWPVEGKKNKVCWQRSAPLDPSLLLWNQHLKWEAVGGRSSTLFLPNHNELAGSPEVTQRSPADRRWVGFWVEPGRRGRVLAL